MAALIGKKPHVMAVAVPGQGHITPLMNLCREIAKRGIKVTFVNARTIHEKLIAAAEDIDDNIALASVPDEIIPDIDPNEPFKLLASLRKTMPLTLPDLIESINNSNPDQKISCIIVDLALGWIVEIAQKMGIEPVGFSVVSMADTAIILQSPKLLEGGIVDTHGSLKKGDVIRLSDDIPPWRKNELPWSSSSDEKIRKKSFEIVMEFRAANQVKWLICNSCYELEPAAYGLYPNFLPLGLFHQSETKSNSGSLLPADSSCLSWLDTKPDGSVIYVSFGSLASFSQQQLEELATGLELSGRPFLWVIRRGLAAGSPLAYPDGFLERVSVLGKIVEWAPQNEILSHPAIACFLSHCGWNSTLEGVSKGVPFLCWACFADQFHNESFICDMWEIGLRIDLDKFGSVRSKHEIKKKIDMIFWSDKFKENALKLKELCAKSIREGGSTYKYFEMFIDYLKNTNTHV